jgi:hypothetical protein
MADSFKDALIKAGVIKKDDIEREKEKVRRDNIQKKGPSQQGIHAHHIRTDCGACGKGAPDVEYYEHSNRSIEAKWLCIPCADKAWIKDECRVTNQSSYSKAGTFRRFFGMTKKFAAGTVVAAPGQNPAAPNRGAPNQAKPAPGKPADAKTAAPAAAPTAKPAPSPQQAQAQAAAKAAERAAMNVPGKVLSKNFKPPRK